MERHTSQKQRWNLHDESIVACSDRNRSWRTTHSRVLLRCCTVSIKGCSPRGVRGEPLSHRHNSVNVRFCFSAIAKWCTSESRSPSCTARCSTVTALLQDPMLPLDTNFMDVEARVSRLPQHVDKTLEAGRIRNTQSDLPRFPRNDTLPRPLCSYSSLLVFRCASTDIWMARGCRWLQGRYSSLEEQFNCRVRIDKAFASSCDASSWLKTVGVTRKSGSYLA